MFIPVQILDRGSEELSCTVPAHCACARLVSLDLKGKQLTAGLTRMTTTDAEVSLSPAKSPCWRSTRSIFEAPTCNRITIQSVD
jgi:hypothetical protein